MIDIINKRNDIVNFMSILLGKEWKKESEWEKKSKLCSIELKIIFFIRTNKRSASKISISY